MSRENSILSGNSVIRHTEIYRISMVRLKIDLKREIKKGIGNVMGTRPLKNIPFAAIFLRFELLQQNRIFLRVSIIVRYTRETLSAR